tara:strand:+ start:1729 stop:2358 length:630 start_codon:yes stop_codon:yes gene_type:complete
MIKNTTYSVRPDRHTTEEINNLQPEDGVIVFDKNEKTSKFWNGEEWVSASSSCGSVGFIDYSDSTGEINLTSDTWTDVPNNGAGAFTNKTYKPTTINEVLDGSTGYLDFSELTLGSQLLIRNDFTVTPNTNNSLLEVRYLLGQGAGEYALKFWSERLDSGSGISYQRVISFPIYMGDTNTQGGVGKLQVKLSTNGSIDNAGSYVKIDLR